MTTKHNPLPWRHEVAQGELGRIVDANGDDVAQTQETRGLLGKEQNANRDALAARIVACVNAHPALVAALEHAEQALVSVHRGLDPNVGGSTITRNEILVVTSDGVHAARRALAAAKGAT